MRAADGELIYRRNATQLLHPASAMKLLTLAAAVERLGWDFRFETTVRATTPLERGGVIRGDLVIAGSGDPTIARRHDGSATLTRWADRLWELGVRRIEGRVIGDGSASGETLLGSGWQWDDLASGYAAPISALSYNENTAELTVAPAVSAGARASVAVGDTAAGLSVSNQIRTVDTGSARRITLERTLDGSRVELRGEVPLGYTPFKLSVAVTNPPLYFARALRERLIARGIVVAGAARSADTAPPGPAPAAAPVLIRHRSPPLREMAVTLMKVSQNLYAELVLRALAGYAHRQDGQWMQFVILANNFAGSLSSADVDRMIDSAVNRLVVSEPPRSP